MGWGEMMLERGKMVRGRGEVRRCDGGDDGDGRMRRAFFFPFLTKGAEVNRRERIIHINFVVKARNEDVAELEDCRAVGERSVCSLSSAISSTRDVSSQLRVYPASQTARAL